MICHTVQLPMRFESTVKSTPRGMITTLIKYVRMSVAGYSRVDGRLCHANLVPSPNSKLDPPLNISFDRPQNATDSEMTEDGFLLRYRGEQLIGVTILDASIRAPWNAVEG
uniref:Uncharacterized protein n=1 Tax=Candidatus Kentrum sp. LPFa TaxID=2126335 RepID=A0A450X4W0_9GAMM|nr:MAG: hypothetical protein BECKLPF1236B_GA0070989_14032 [Candidatus Kentron sp. LPFa]